MGRLIRFLAIKRLNHVTLVNSNNTCKNKLVQRNQKMKNVKLRPWINYPQVKNHLTKGYRCFSTCYQSR